ncbi:sulfate adenylyltransferase subunit 1 [Qipengyuania sp.]|uniref:sulfate adenylyltransferase subunit 1 n=1 Tax=Qipengyuania sp. TaxID=2004515 RepID=UPI0035C83D41
MHGQAVSRVVGDSRPETSAGERDLLRFITCGSVDDGKSTLIGRLLYETNSVPADQLETLAAESRRFGTQGTQLDLSLLVDGLSAEREQGITIDVAYRYFATQRRKFIVIDAPGHEQYTRNMVTGASQADYGVLLADARQGLTEQTKRHARVLKLLGISGMVLAVNKMDRVRFLQEPFDDVVSAFAEFAEAEGVDRFDSVPLSALTGANVASPSGAMPWYDGPPLLGLLETTPLAVRQVDASEPFRMAVQLALRPDESFRGFAGTISSGEVAVGDKVVVQPSGHSTSVARIVTMDGDFERAQSGQAVVVVLADHVDCSRGDVIATAEQPLPMAHRASAELVWLNERPFERSRDYVLKATTRTLAVQVDIRRGDETPVLNAIQHVDLSFASDLPVELYRRDHRFGAFILIDKETRQTVACGMIDALEESAAGSRKGTGENIVWFDAAHPDAQRELSRIITALSASGSRVMSFDDAVLASDLCADIESGSPEWGRRAHAAARLAARSGATVVVATTAALPLGSEARLVREASAIANDWVI